MMYPALAMVFWAAGRHRKKPAEIRRRRVSAASEPDAACGPEEGAEELASLCGLVYLRESNGQTRTDESAKAARCFRLFILSPPPSVCLSRAGPLNIPRFCPRALLRLLPRSASLWGASAANSREIRSRGIAIRGILAVAERMTGTREELSSGFAWLVCQSTTRRCSGWRFNIPADPSGNSFPFPWAGACCSLRGAHRAGEMRRERHFEMH